MRRIIEALVDKGSFFEMGAMFGRSIITGFCRLDGWPVALMAGDPLFAGGAWTADACNKIIRFVDMAQTFHLPIVHLVDCPGFQVGLAAESSAVIRWGVRALSAINQTTVPWCSIVVRNCYGVGGLGHQPVSHLCVRYAWPSASWGSLPLEGGIEAAYRAEIDASEDPAAKMEEIEARLNRLRSPFRTAESFWVEEVIDPRETRRLLCEFANMAAPLRTPGESAVLRCGRRGGEARKASRRLWSAMCGPSVIDVKATVTGGDLWPFPLWQGFCGLPGAGSTHIRWPALRPTRVEFGGWLRGRRCRAVSPPPCLPRCLRERGFSRGRASGRRGRPLSGPGASGVRYSTMGQGGPVASGAAGSEPGVS